MSGRGIYSKISDEQALPLDVLPRPRTWLVGESNPYGSDPDHALYPYPPGCSGARLCAFLGLSDDEYLGRFERRNLLSQARWSAPAARRAAALLLAEVGDGDRLVLLGAKVAQAFRFDFRPLTIHDQAYAHLTGGDQIHVRVLLAPHPSGMRAALGELEGRR
jgi:hypothetical protein